MIIQGNQFGDNGELGWGLKSIGRGIKKVGKGAYNVAKMPAAMAKRVAAASAGVLCDKDGNPRDPNSSTSVNFCRGVKLKQQATLTKYLPAAAAAASKVQAVRQQIATPAAPAKTIPAPTVATAEAEYIDEFSGFGDGCAGTRATKVWRNDDGSLSWAFNTAAARAARANCGITESAQEYAASRDLGSPDMNLLASLAGADMNDLSFALAGITPVDINGSVTKEDVAMFAPSAVAVGLGLWLLFKKG